MCIIQFTRRIISGTPNDKEAMEINVQLAIMLVKGGIWIIIKDTMHINQFRHILIRGTGKDGEVTTITMQLALTIN